MPRVPKLGRRTLLRGVGGAAIALPLLEIMMEGKTLAADGTNADGIPLRYLVAFGGFSLGNDGDPASAQYVPDTVGPGYDLKAGLAPLAGFGNVAQDVTVVSGLRIPAPTSGIDSPAGGRAGGDSFHFHTNPLLCGRGQVGGVFSTAVTGASSDQVVADQNAGDTLFHSLTTRAQALYYSAGGNFVVDNPLNRDTLAFRADGGGEHRAVVPYVSPRQTYDALFATFAPSDPVAAAAKAYELGKRRSILDLVDRRLGGLLPRLGASDQQRLQRHFDELRGLETRLGAPPPAETATCKLLPDPGADPALGGELDNPGDYDINKGYSGEEDRATLLVDLIHMAFTCDLTRSATLMLTMFQSFMNLQPLVGVSEQAHNLNHGGPVTDLERFIAWHAGHFGRLVSLLRDTPEAGGSVLDNCALVFLNEGGHGGDPYFGADFTSHTTEGMVALVAGGAGGLVGGEHLVAPAGQNHPANVLITAMNAVGVASDTFGEVTGSIPALRPG